MLLNTVLVSIKRDTNTITRYVNQYEVELLKAIHGDDDRCIVHDDIKVIEVDLNVQDEYRRLSDLYRRDADTFFRIYRNERDLQLAIDLAVNDDAVSPETGEKVVLKKQAKVSV